MITKTSVDEVRPKIITTLEHVTAVKYETSDNRVFKNLEDAERHELSIRLSEHRIDNVPEPMDDFGYIGYKLPDFDALSDFYVFYNIPANTRNVIFGKVKIGGVLYILVESDSRYGDSCTIYTHEYLKESAKYYYYLEDKAV